MGGRKTIARAEGFLSIYSVKTRYNCMKKILLSVFVLSILVPSIAFASWWNPFTWFKKSTQATIEQTVQIKPNDATVKEKPKLVDKKVPEKKTVTKNTNTPQEKSIKEVTTSTTSPVVTILPPPDLCKNVEGAQSSYIPRGMYREKDGNCYPKPIEIYFPEPQTTQNTTPPLATVPTVDNTPKERTLDQLTSLGISASSNSLGFGFYTLQKGDKINLEVNGVTYNKVSDSSQVSITVDNLDPETNYPYSIKVERGNEYANFANSITTDLGFKCTTNCYNAFSKSIEITKLTFFVWSDATDTCHVKVIKDTDHPLNIEEVYAQDIQSTPILKVQKIEAPVSIIVKPKTGIRILPLSCIVQTQNFSLEHSEWHLIN